ncbi:unnamed protein product [Caenorhabditis bovis]|uniref:Phospholipase A2 domain-containing protein n=1 Tax=Caenorhabditis bovis TaxID=2654633 RepID=A0A8S1EYX2_9PELO|nr:unnamed protein product [Caenorhabditis bovis]
MWRLVVCLLLPTIVPLTSAARPTPRILRTTTTTTTTTTEPTITTASFKVVTPKIQINSSWECGTDAFTKAISEGEILAKCPKLRDHVNSCCYQHDNCYDEQRGQNFCDDHFCGCLEVVTRSSKLCHTESSPIFCDLVRTFGNEPYKNSAPNATTTTDEGLLDKDDYDYEAAVRNISMKL